MPNAPARGIPSLRKYSSEPTLVVPEQADVAQFHGQELDSVGQPS